MPRLSVTVLAALVAVPALAQEVVLGGWSLPEGALVRSRSTVTMAGALRRPDGAVPFENTRTETVRTEIDRVEDGRLTRAVQRAEASNSKGTIGGTRIPAERDPLLGRDVAVVRTGAGWRQEPDGWRPSEEARRALAEPVSLDDAEYPERPVAVGETVTVSEEAIRAVYPNATAGDHRLTVRLDSLGTFEGGPAAYLTQEVGITVDTGDGGTMRMDMTARIVRRLDWMLDVRTVWEGPVAFDYGAVTLAGDMRYEGSQTVAPPADD